MQLNPATTQLRGRPLPSPMPLIKPDSLSLAAVTGLLLWITSPCSRCSVINPSRTFQTLDSVTSRRRPCVIDSEWYTSLAFGAKQLMPYPATPLARKPQKCWSYQITVTPVIHLPHPHLIHTSAHSWITCAVTSRRSHHAPLQSMTSCIISFISAAYYSSHIGQGQSGDSERRRYGTPDVHHWVCLPKLLPWAATRTEGVLSVPQPPLHSRQCHPLQGQNSHTTFTPPTCPVCPPLSTSGCDFHDCLHRNNCLMVRHTPAITASRTNCYHCNRMAPSQPNAPPSPPVPPAYTPSSAYALISSTTRASTTLS